MFKTAKELQDFILWAKENLIKRVKVDNIEVEISDLAFINELNAPKSQLETVETAQTEAPSLDKYGRPVDDPDLYHSVTN